MKKIEIIVSIIAIAGIAATSWQIEVYNQNVEEVRHALETENFSLHVAVADLQTKLNLLTNHPTVAAKAGNI